MTVTQTYAAIHRALCDTAERHGLIPSEMRVLVAVADRGGAARTDELERDLRLRNGTTVRRAMSSLRRGGFLDGGSTRGRRDALRLTTDGRRVHRVFAQSLVNLEKELNDGAK